MRHIYLGGPITGLEFDEAVRWREEFALSLAQRDPEWVCLSPMRDKEQFRVAGPLPSTFDEGAAAVTQDLRDIRRSDVCLFNFLGAERTSLGSSAEMGYAYGQNKFIVVAMEPECIHDHVFTTYMATAIVPSLDAVLDTLDDWSRRGVLALAA